MVNVPTLPAGLTSLLEKRLGQNWQQQESTIQALAKSVTARVSVPPEAVDANVDRVLQEYMMQLFNAVANLPKGSSETTSGAPKLPGRDETFTGVTG